MCCLFGLLDYKHSLTTKQQDKILSVLSRACEARGTDATGIAYNLNNELHIYKRPVPAHRMHFHIPHNAHAVMGHTRMTTQGDELFNYNNHPFAGRTGNIDFALAHNGVLHNDLQLRKQEKLPQTQIETDSYVAVQLIEKCEVLNFDSLRYMAEQLDGSFTITVMDQEGGLYFVKGDNPMCVYHFEEKGIYIYASTEDILKAALRRIPYRFGQGKKVSLSCGDILIIDKSGRQARAAFNTDRLLMRSYCPYYLKGIRGNDVGSNYTNEYIKELKTAASRLGYTSEYIDYLLDEGFSTDDIEEVLYCG